MDEFFCSPVLPYRACGFSGEDRSAGELDLDSVYETMPKWHGFLMIKPPALVDGFNSEPQNFEGWNRYALSF